MEGTESTHIVHYGREKRGSSGSDNTKSKNGGESSI